MRAEWPKRVRLWAATIQSFARANRSLANHRNLRGGVLVRAVTPHRGAVGVGKHAGVRSGVAGLEDPLHATWTSCHEGLPLKSGPASPTRLPATSM